MPVIPGVTVDFVASPRIIFIPQGIQEVSAYDMHQTLADIEDNPDGITFPKLRDTSGGQSLGGGLQVGWTMQLNNAVLLFTPLSTPQVSGAASADDSTGKRLTDSSAHFIADQIYPGCVIINWTTRAIAIVIQVLSETQLRHTLLSGGLSAEWTTGDQYSIFHNQPHVLTGGNWTALNNQQQPIEPAAGSFGVQVVRTAASSATTVTVGGSDLQQVLDAINALNDLSQSDVRAAIGLASANLDAQLATLGEALSGLNDLDAAEVRQAVGLAAADLDAQLAALQAQVTLARKLLQNRNQTNPITHKHEFFDDDGAMLMSGPAWEDAGGTIPFGPSSTKIQRRDRLEEP